MVAAAATDVSVPISWASSKHALESQERPSEAPTSEGGASGDEHAAIETPVIERLSEEAQTVLTEATDRGETDERVFTPAQEARIRVLIREELTRTVLRGVKRE